MPDFPAAIRNELVDWVIGKADPSPASGARYLALFDGDPQGSGSEVTSTVRAAGRLSFTDAMEVAGATSGGLSANTTEIDFGEAAVGSTGTQVTHIAIYSAATAGTLIASDALTGGIQTITEGNPVKIPVGDLSVSIA
jgi:hypothetical protein